MPLCTEVLRPHALPRRERDRLHFDVLAGEQEARLQDGGAWRDVAPERGAARAVILLHRAVVRVVLVHAHDIAELAATRFQHPGEIRENPVRFPAVPGTVPGRQLGTHHGERHAAAEVVGAFEAGGEDPASGLDARRVADIALWQRDGQQRFDRRTDTLRHGQDSAPAAEELQFCAVMPAALITGVQRAMSSRRNFANASGVLVRASQPAFRMRSWTSGRLSTRTISAFILLMSGAGTRAGNTAP